MEKPQALLTGSRTALRNTRLFAWLLLLTAVGLAIGVWAGHRLDGRPFDIYSFFPVLGLSAFSIMWCQYVVGAVRRVAGLKKQDIEPFFQVTTPMAFVLILLHPGIFLTALWFDGFGLPPASYFQVYTDFLQRTALAAGSVSLLGFLSFQLYRKFKQASWWRYVEYVNIAAMFGIFYHSLTLGGELQIEWFRSIWIGYGIVLIISLIVAAYYDKKRGES